MKIAVVTDDEKIISAHFGKASKYVVYSVENGKISGLEIREKTGQCKSGEDHHSISHHHNDEKDGGRGMGKNAEDKHQRMFANILDCDILLARGMGRGARLGLESSGLKPIITDIAEINKAVEAVINGSIVDHPDCVH